MRGLCLEGVLIKFESELVGQALSTLFIVVKRLTKYNNGSVRNPRGPVF